MPPFASPASSKRRAPLGVCGLGLALAVLSLPSLAHAGSYSEAVNGDLSNNGADPTPVAFTFGDNIVSGSTAPGVDPVTGAMTLDNDFMTFTIPNGEVLSQIVVDAGTSILTGDRMFFGIASGQKAIVDPSFTSAAGLLGWTLVSPSMVGSNVLPALGLSAPANFPSIPGATGFSGSLGPGDYTVWLLDGDNPAAYTLDFKVGAAPEPAAWLLMLCGLGFIGAMLRSRERRGAPALA